ncbi:MAG TPA: DNA-binding response regulator [Cyanobacteria bacterium UBA8553]|nr:DNA-binding response regulator [Cyanobacteria bacterium UBA8553]
MRILLVEDDERLSDVIAEDLTDHHYVIEVASDGQFGWELADTYTYDLILLDVMLPKIDGITLCQRLRSQGCCIPILMLTARDTINDKVIGLDAGADDYLVKPFDLQELSARVRALLRRGSSTLPPVLEWENLTLNPSTCEVFYKERLLPLSPKEYSLLEFFLRNRRRVFSRAQILEHLWSFERLPEEATVKAHIRSLRHKLESVGAPGDLIETVYGLGYRLKQTS